MSLAVVNWYGSAFQYCFSSFDMHYIPSVFLFSCR